MTRNDTGCQSRHINDILPGVLLKIAERRNEYMKTPPDVGKYRCKIIHNVLAGALTIDQAEALQKLTDAEIMRLIRKG